MKIIKKRKYIYSTGFIGGEKTGMEVDPCCSRVNCSAFYLLLHVILPNFGSAIEKKN